jgi:hypothetical protein
MGWFRSNRRLWGIAALAALSLQIALSFGHVHGFEANHAGGVVLADAGGQTPAAPTIRTPTTARSARSTRC